MSSFYTVEGVLASAVADAGTFTVSYPTGARLGTFRSGKLHKLVVNGTLYSAPEQFTVAWTSATVITITNGSGASFPVGARYILQLDVGGSVGLKSVTNVDVLNTKVMTLARINLGAPIAADTDGVATTELLGSAGDIPIDGVRASGGVATLDVPRNVTLTVATTNHSALTLTVYGTDEYGNTVIEAITGPNNNTVSGKKAFKTVTRVASSGAIATNGISVGFGDVLGLPIFVGGGGVMRELEDGATASSGTFVAGLSPLTKSTSTTADVRGTYDPNSAADGAKVFELDCFIQDPDFLGNPQFDG